MNVLIGPVSVIFINVWQWSLNMKWKAIPVIMEHQLFQFYVFQVSFIWGDMYPVNCSVVHNSIFKGYLFHISVFFIVLQCILIVYVYVDTFKSPLLESIVPWRDNSFIPFHRFSKQKIQLQVSRVLQFTNSDFGSSGFFNCTLKIPYR